VNAKPKRRSPQRRRKPEQAHAVSAFKQFHCENVIYELTVPIESFDAKVFSKRTGIGPDEYWSTVLPSDDPNSGYHVHFKGSIQTKRVRMTVEYWEGGVTRTKRHPQPSAESIMSWIGSLIKTPSIRALVTTRFEMPLDMWRSRFNLPFKVTMAGAEVVITGVTLTLPSNKFRATNGFVNKLEKYLGVAMGFAQPLEFSTFDLAVDLARFNEAIKMIAEPI
jgi:hypothetical protein